MEMFFFSEGCGTVLNKIMFEDSILSVSFL